MGKSSSCFRLITCGGGDAAEKDDQQVVSEVTCLMDSEIKDSNDKHGWSFRKRSARHRVLSNTVITETPSSTNKETSESINFQSLAEPNVVEKICTTNLSNEKPQLSSIASSEVSETIVTETEEKMGVNLPESVVIIIQAAIRGYLAQRALLKSKNVVKLQAAVRGHLVRRHAVGTLRCVQAIVKMQLLVRARHAQQSYSEDHLNHKGNEHHMNKSNVKHTSIEKLLSNKFARQLLESTPKNKPIHVKCDSSKADSGWKWLERWMSVSAKDSAEYKKPICMSEQSDETKDSTHVSQLEKGIPSEVIHQLADSKPTIGDSPLTSEDEEKTTTSDANNSNFQASPSTSSLVKDNLEQAPPEKTITDNAKVTSAEIDSFQNEKMESVASVPQELQASPSTSSFVEDNLERAPPGKTLTDDAKITSTEVDSFQIEKMESDASVPQEPSPPRKPEIDGEQCEQSVKTFASNQLETEGKKFGRGSRKLSNPAFIAAQSKFEEPSLMASSGMSSSLSNQDVSVESQADTSSVVTDTAYRSKEFFSPENSAPYPSRTGGSECGTELTISSTLASPDRSEVRTKESDHDAKDLVKGTVNPENKNNHGVEANTGCATPASNLPISDLDQLEIVNDTSGNIVNSVVPGNLKEPAVEPEKNESDLLREQTDTVLQDFKLSPEASPGSHLTIPESQGTPSSQVSVKPKNKTGSSNRRRILSVGNKSPASANNDSGSRRSGEQLPKGQLNVKRRNSFGPVKPDNIDQEPRENSSNNNSLPHFMQATESAKAKINANNSPRSSPDVHDQGSHIKKRHSLPGATPRTQGTKGNGVNERQWLR